ncbi:MAG: hypothetical protein J5794_09390, partial [Lachnospiraceae bacterium]|nr:hypothetical protein [Lachnospiraceae bacterium]
VLYLNPVAGGEEDYMETYLTELRSVDAFGGGDMPEAVEEAMEEAMRLNWTNESSTKMIFHVFDAPSHSSDLISERYDNAVRAAAEKGVRICPVISSGADLLAEFQGRAEALLTGGTFVYLTDDSGIGGPHLDPNLPDAVHEYLNALMVRLIKGYYTGTFEEPVAWVKAD